MSDNKNIEALAEFIEHCCCEPQYRIPFTHEELIDILLRIRDGHVLSENEYDLIMMLLGSEDNENIGDALFSGDYLDLINKPFIPRKLSDLQDYNIIMTRINSMFNDLSDKDNIIMESVNDVARFLSAIEVALANDVENLTKLIEACTLFQGESLEDVIRNIQDELGWLDDLKDDIAEGKVLSESDFTAIYAEILKSIADTEEGLIGIIKGVIRDSIADPGKPNGNGVFTLDTIGEALSKKVNISDLDKIAQNNFTNEYKNLLDPALKVGDLREYILGIIKQYEDVFEKYMADLGEMLLESLIGELDDLRKEVEEENNEMKETIEVIQKEAITGVKFEVGEGPVSINIGGLEKGTILENRSVKDVLLELICPFVTPVVSGDLILSYPQALYEIGDKVEISGIQAYVEQGSLPIKQIVFKERIGNTYKIIGTKLGSDSTAHYFPEVYELTHTIDDTYFMIEVEDIEGNRSTCGAGSINFVCPIFYGNFKEDEEISESSVRNKLHKQLKYMGEECKYEYTTNNERMVLAVPQEYGSISDIYDQNGYIITNSFNVEVVSFRFTVKEKIGDSYRENEYIKPYYIYYNNPNTVYGFEITYKF